LQLTSDKVHQNYGWLREIKIINIIKGFLAGYLIFLKMILSFTDFYSAEKNQGLLELGPMMEYIFTCDCL